MHVGAALRLSVQQTAWSNWAAACRGGDEGQQVSLIGSFFYSQPPAVPLTVTNNQ